MPELDSSFETALQSEQGPVLPEPGATLDRDLNLEGCGAVTSLPERLTVHGNLSLRGTQLTRLPAFLCVHGSVELEGVQTLVEIGEHVVIKGNLDLEGCSNLRCLPDHLKVDGDVFLAGSAVRIVSTTNRIAGRVYDLI